MSSMAGTDSVFASKESGVTGQVPEAEVNVNEEILKVGITDRHYPTHSENKIWNEMGLSWESTACMQKAVDLRIRRIRLLLVCLQ